MRVKQLEVGLRWSLGGRICDQGDGWGLNVGSGCLGVVGLASTIRGELEIKKQGIRSGM